MAVSQYLRTESQKESEDFSTPQQFPPKSGYKIVTSDMNKKLKTSKNQKLQTVLCVKIK